jgi:glycosyltransferase involved in cell wall biosynthesis
VAAPRVTLGVPVYNGERYLAETLDSLLAQDFADFELIVSDNASTDATPYICAEYAARDPRIRYVRNERNLGAAKNYNRLVELARAPYFKWASSDDLCAPALLSRCVEVLDADPGVVVAYPKTVFIDESGVRIGDFEDRLHMPQREPWERLRHFATNWNRCNACFGLIRTDVLRRTGLIRPNAHSDVTLLAELTLAGRFFEVPERLFFRRITETSCGLGRLTVDQIAAWFDPSRPRSFVPRRMRLFLQIQRAITAIPLPASQRVRCMWAFGEAWTERRVRAFGGKYRRKLFSLVRST